MENASKALTIAGGMLFSIAVVGLLIFGFQRLRSYQNTQDESIKTQQVAEFNNQLEAYNKQVVPGYQMISLANYVKDLNGRSKDEGFKEITLKVDMKLASNGNYCNVKQSGGTTISGKKIDFDHFENVVTATYSDGKTAYELFPDKGTQSKADFKQSYFKCTNVEDDTRTGRIWKMEFEKLSRSN